MTRLVAMIVVALVAVPTAASADGSKGKARKSAKHKPAPASVADTKLEKVGSPVTRLTLPGGKFMLTVAAEANMAKDQVGKPISIAPDLWIGVADRLTFGIVHSGRAATGFLTGFGTGLCFRGGGAAGACGLGLGDVYTFVGGEARIGLTQGGFATAFVLGAQARAFDPKLVMSGKAGLIVRMSSSRIALELAPAVYIGLTQRDFNPDVFGAPVTIFLRVGGQFALALQSGVTFGLKHAGDTWRIPAAAGIAWWVTPHVSFDVAFGLAAVADSDDATKAFDNRSATVGLGYAL